VHVTNKEGVFVTQHFAIAGVQVSYKKRVSGYTEQLLQLTELPSAIVSSSQLSYQ